MTRTLILIRHPEAQKNIEDRHGGGGSLLTEAGLRQCERIAQYLHTEFDLSAGCILVGHRVPHVEETVQRLSSLLEVVPTWDERLCGLNLGVLAGLSRSEAAVRWPEAARRLELWRAGQLTMDKLNIPGGEAVDLFKERTEHLLKDWLGPTSPRLVVAVCTRSTLIMLVNMIELGADFTYARYRSLTFTSGSITRVEASSTELKVTAINMIAHL